MPASSHIRKLSVPFLLGELFLVIVAGILFFAGAMMPFLFRHIGTGKVLGSSITGAPYPIQLGSVLNNYNVANCNMNNTGILTSYQNSGVRALVQQQLAQTLRNGSQTLRFNIWFMTDIGNNAWGVIPSSGGKVSDPYRTNLIDYLTDIKKAGFTKLQITLAPMWKNSPAYSCQDTNPNAGCYDPMKFTENWNFIQDARSLAKQYGPSNTVFDIAPEIPPSNYMTSYDVSQAETYIQTIYADYVQKYGNADVTISYSAPNNATDANGHILENLISAINASGEPKPLWLEPHIYPTSYADALYALEHSDSVLNSSGWTATSLVIGETYYDDNNVAQAALYFAQNYSRKILEIREWPVLSTETTPGCQQDVTAPYILTNFLTEIDGTSASGSVNVSLGSPNTSILYNGTIKSSWSGVHLDSGGRGVGEVCVSEDGAIPALLGMSANFSQQGSLVSNVSWLQSQHTYVFTLYDEFGSGGFPTCGGIILAQQSLTVPTVPVATSSPKPVSSGTTNATAPTTKPTSVSSQPSVSSVSSVQQGQSSSSKTGGYVISTIKIDTTSPVSVIRVDFNKGASMADTNGYAIIPTGATVVKDIVVDGKTIQANIAVTALKGYEIKIDPKRGVVLTVLSYTGQNIPSTLIIILLIFGSMLLLLIVPFFFRNKLFQLAAKNPFMQHATTSEKL